MSKLPMRKIDRKTISKKNIIIKNLKKIIKSENILDHEEQVKPFETDGLSAYKQKPMLVVFPENTKEVSEILSYCNKEKIKVVPRGAGTGLSGGALPLADSILLSLTKFNRMLAAKGNAPPDKPVPAPRGTTFIFSLLQYESISLTSLVFSGNTTSIGFCL
jgi:glycolate oxidase